MVYASHHTGVQPSVFCMSDRKQTVTVGLTYMSQLPCETEVVATGAGSTHSTRMLDASMSSDLACPCPTHFHQKFSHAQEYSLKYLLLKSTVFHQCLVTRQIRDAKSQDVILHSNMNWNQVDRLCSQGKQTKRAHVIHISHFKNQINLYPKHPDNGKG